MGWLSKGALNIEQICLWVWFGLVLIMHLMFSILDDLYLGLSSGFNFTTAYTVQLHCVSNSFICLMYRFRDVCQHR